MRTVPHRELRNNSSRILAEVKAGEMVKVTNGGEVAAILVPPTLSPYQLYHLAGKVTKVDPVELLDKVVAVRSDESIAEVLDELRGEH